MPSRKIISVLIVASALVASVILASGPKEERKSSKQIVVTSSNVQIAGTADWKSDLGALPETNTIPASAPTTVTDQVSQSLISNYLVMKQQNALDSESAQAMVDQAASLAEGGNENKYTSGNLLISRDNSMAAIKAYGSALGSVFKLNRPVSTKNEIEIFNKMLGSKNEALAQDLKSIAATYHNIASSLVKTTVPSSYASAHLGTANSLENMAKSVDAMSQAFQDPMKALLALSWYQTSYATYVSAMAEIKFGINKSGIIYKQGESGYYFYFGI